MKSFRECIGATKDEDIGNEGLREERAFNLGAEEKEKEMLRFFQRVLDHKNGHPIIISEAYANWKKEQEGK